MFKNCCGCKTPTEKKLPGGKEKDSEVYSKSCAKADGGAKCVSPSKVVPKPESALAGGNVTAAPAKSLGEQERAKVLAAASAAPAAGVASPEAKQTPPPPPPPAPAAPRAQPAPSEADKPGARESPPSQSGSPAATTATAASTAASGAEDLSADGEASKPASPEPDACDSDTATLRAFTHGMLATPHPSKRSGSVPGLGSLPQWLSQEDDDDDVFREGGGTTEPPATPVGRDELALRRHRFFSDLLQAHQAATEHRVRFDPLGPIVAGFEHEQRTPTVEFESLLNRLEKVTTRLEQTVSATEEALLKQGGLKSSNEQVVTNEKLKQIETVNNTYDSKAAEITKQSEYNIIILQDPPKSFQEKPCEKSNSQSPKSNFTMSVGAFQDILNGPFTSFLASSHQIGGDVATISEHVKKAFQAQLQYLSLAAQSASPSMDHNMKLLEPTSAQIKAIQDFREKHRGSPHFNHLSAVSESIAALGWVTVSPAPAPYVKEMNDAGQFYTNRVLKEWKEKDKTHKVWVDSWVETLSELQKFVKQHHTTGLVWAGKGSVPAGVPPPPPPGLPPPPPEMPIGDVPPSSDAQDRSALFAEINKGEAITSSLKKVTPDMQTHKNPTLRSGPAPFKAPVHTNTYRSVTAPGQLVEKPPNFTKEGKKWLVEFHKGNHSLLIDQTEMNNVIYMYKCADSTLTVKGKVNSVVLDSCRKSSVVFDSVVSSIEFVNCQSVQMQVINKVPTISIDKTDGCQMYLSSDSLDVEIVSAKSTEMNVMVPKTNGDYTEYPVPEQFKTTISPKGLLTVAIESKG